MVAHLTERAKGEGLAKNSAIMVNPVTSTTADVSADEVRAELARILDSQAFANAASLRRLLQYLVNHALAGQPGSLKEYAIALAVFDRPESFDPRTDTIVRVQARRLRARLQGYHEHEGRADPVVHGFSSS